MADTSIGKAYVQIIPKAEGFSKNVESAIGGDVEKSGDNAGSSMGKAIIGGLAKAGVVAAVGKIFKDSIEAGGNLQQSFGGLDTLYGDAADAAKEYAYAAAEAGISANDYAEQAVSFGAGLKQAFGGDTAKAAKAANTAILDMADNAAKMGTPLESIQNAYQGFAKSNYTMLDNLKLGYGGTKEEMERLLADASELSGVEYDMSNLGDVYDAIHVIQEDLGLTGVAAEEASTTFTGSFGAMKAAATNLLADLALGNDISADLSTLGNTLKTFVVGNLLPMIGNIAKQIPSIIGQLPSFIASAMPQVQAAAGEIVSGLANGIVTYTPMFISGIGDLLQGAWDSLVNFDWNSAAQIAVDLLKAGWEGLKTAASGIWDFVVGIFTGEVPFPDLSEAARTVWNGLVDVASDIWVSVSGWFTTTFTWPNISEAAKTVWSGLITVAEYIWTAVKTWFTKTFTWPNITEAARSVWDGLVTTAEFIWISVKTWFTKTFDFPSLSEMASAAWNGLVTTAEYVWTSVKSWFTKTFDFPSLTEIAKAAWSGLTTAAEYVWNTIKAWFGKVFDFPDLTEAASAAWSTLSGAAETIWNGVADVFGSIDIEWPNFAEMASGAFEGLKNAAKSVWDWVAGLFSGENEDEAVKSVQGSTSEMAAAFADAELKISSVDVSNIQTANEFVKNTVIGWKNIFDNMALKIPSIGHNTLRSTRNLIENAVEAFKRTMKFSWSLPTLHGHLPVISVNMRQASSSDGKTTVSYPDLSVSSFKWFAKGGIFDSPQIIGIGDSDGPEAAVPLDMMWKRMGQEFDDHLGNGASITNYFTVNGAEDPALYAEVLARELKQQLRMA